MTEMEFLRAEVARLEGGAEFRRLRTVADEALRERVAIVDSERLARVALEERLDKVERARVYAEDQVSAARRITLEMERAVERLEASVASRDAKERGKIERQKATIRDLEARNAKLVEKVAAQWASAEAAKTRASATERASTTSEDAQTIWALRDEVARLAALRVPGDDAALQGEIRRLQEQVAESERWRQGLGLLLRGPVRAEASWGHIWQRVDSAGDVLAALRAYLNDRGSLMRAVEVLREHDRKGLS